MFRGASSPYNVSGNNSQAALMGSSQKQFMGPAGNNDTSPWVAIRETGASGKETLDGLWLLTVYCVSPDSSHHSSENRKG